MSIRYWLYAIALGGCLSLGAFGGANAEHHPDTSAASEQAAATQEAENPTPAAEYPYIEKKHPAISQQTCDEARRHGMVVDECQQREMAAAAVEQADLTAKLYALTKWEIGFLLAALVLSALATAAAIGAFWITRVTARHQLRAYVLPNNVGFADVETDGLAIAINFKNSGQTPARRVSHILKFEITSAPRCTLSVSDDELRDGSDIGPGEYSSGNYLEPLTNSFAANSAEIEVGIKIAYAYGKLVYFDIFDRRQWVEFWFQYSHQQDMFVSCDEGFNAT